MLEKDKTSPRALQINKNFNLLGAKISTLGMAGTLELEL